MTNAINKILNILNVNKNADKIPSTLETLQNNENKNEEPETIPRITPETKKLDTKIINPITEKVKKSASASPKINEIIEKVKKSASASPRINETIDSSNLKFLKLSNDSSDISPRIVEEGSDILSMESLEGENSTESENDMIERNLIISKYNIPRLNTSSIRSNSSPSTVNRVRSSSESKYTPLSTSRLRSQSIDEERERHLHARIRTYQLNSHPDCEDCKKEELKNRQTLMYVIFYELYKSQEINNLKGHLAEIMENQAYNNQMMKIFLTDLEERERKLQKKYESLYEYQIYYNLRKTNVSSEKLPIINKLQSNDDFSPQLKIITDISNPEFNIKEKAVRVSSSEELLPLRFRGSTVKLSDEEMNNKYCIILGRFLEYYDIFSLKFKKLYNMDLPKDILDECLKFNLGVDIHNFECSIDKILMSVKPLVFPENFLQNEICKHIANEFSIKPHEVSEVFTKPQTDYEILRYIDGSELQGVGGTRSHLSYFNQKVNDLFLRYASKSTSKDIQLTTILGNCNAQLNFMRGILSKIYVKLITTMSPREALPEKIIETPRGGMIRSLEDFKFNLKVIDRMSEDKFSSLNLTNDQDFEDLKNYATIYLSSCSRLSSFIEDGLNVMIKIQANSREGSRIQPRFKFTSLHQSIDTPMDKSVKIMDMLNRMKIIKIYMKTHINFLKDRMYFLTDYENNLV